MSEMPSAVCDNCGKRYYGWALENPEHRTCEECGGDLKIEKGKEENQ
jgi:rRNA maturation endonuclease Nob1